jgi:hypothetical protein
MAELTPRQMLALRHITERPMTQIELGEEMFALDRPEANKAGGRLLRALCRKGLAQQLGRKWHPTDAGRSALASPTQAAAE